MSLTIKNRPKWFSIFLNTQVIFSILFCGFMIISGILGFKWYAVRSNSMYPAIQKGYTIAVNTRTMPQDVEVGDIIAFNLGEETSVTHRVISHDKEQELIYTKGDRNNAPDAGPVYYTQYIGKVKAVVPVLGWVQIALRGILSKIIIIGIIAFDIIMEVIFIKKDKKLIAELNKEGENNEVKE